MLRIYLSAILWMAFISMGSSQMIESVPWPEQPVMICELDQQILEMLPVTNPQGPASWCAGQNVGFHRTQWFSFVAATTELIFNVELLDSQLGQGFQLQVMQAQDSSCIGMNPVSECYDQVLTGITVPLTGLVLGEEYLVIIDGYQNDLCTLLFSVLDGAIGPPKPKNKTFLDGPSTMSSGQAGTFTLVTQPDPDAPDYCGRYQCGALDTCQSSTPPVITWTAPADVQIVQIAPDGLSADVIWGNTPGEICITLEDECGSRSYCKFVAVKEEIWDIFCEGEGYFFCGAVYNAPGVYLCEEVDPQSGEVAWVTELTLEMIPEEILHLEETLCAGDVFSWNGQDFSQSGQYTFYDDQGGPCPVRVELELTILPPQQEFLTVELCPGELFTYDADHTFQAPGMFEFTTPNAAGCDVTVWLELTAPEFNLAVETTGDTLDCCHPVQTLTASAATGVLISWLLPDGSTSTGPILEAATPGLYEVIASQAGCQESAFVKLVATPCCPTVMIKGGDLTCAQASVDLQAAIDPGLGLEIGLD